MKLRYLALALAVLGTFVLSGCSGFAEIEELIVVSGAAIDFDGEEYTVTAEIIDLQRGSQETAYKTFYLEGRGGSISEAISQMGRVTGKELYWGHASVFVIGKGVAERSLLPVLEWFLHDTLAAFSSMLVLADTPKAADVYGFVSPTENSVSFALEKIMTNYSSRKERGSAAIFEMIDKCSAEGVATIIPVISGKENGDETVIEISGLAVFSWDKLRGIYAPEDAEVLKLILESNSGKVFAADTGEETVHFHCGRSKCDFDAKYENGKLYVDVMLEAELKLVDVDGEAGVLDEEFLQRFSDSAGEVLKAKGEKVIMQDVEEFGCDILGVGQYFERCHPGLWEGIKDRWEEVYRSGEFVLTVETKVGQSGEASKTLTLATE
ncbi:MAG: Ger(x)C family spore germination protein [Clostridia bacterium]|nr:Ger(x)C family spore germination protein [Clostridia bacterium]